MSKNTKNAAPPRRNAERAIPTHWGIGPDPEELDPTPVEIPAAFDRPPTMAEQIAEAVHAQLSAKDKSLDSPEEADDFEEEDSDLLDFSPYEAILQPTYEELETPSMAPAEDEVPPPDPTPEEGGDQPPAS